MGNCNHRRYDARLIELVRSGTVDPVRILSKIVPMQNAVEAYKAFDRREPDWIKVEPKPAAACCTTSVTDIASDRRCHRRPETNCCKSLSICFWS